MFPLGPQQQGNFFMNRRQQRWMNQQGAGYPFQNNLYYGQGQVNSPFRRGFMAQQRQQAQQAQQFFNQQPQNYPQQQQQQPPPQGLGSLVKDENGNFDIKKVGNGVQSVIGIANQAGPLLKMFNGLF